MNTQALITDFDDTLVILDQRRWSEFRRLLGGFGLSNSDLGELEARRGKSFRNLVGSLLCDSDFEAFLEVYLRLLRRLPPRGTPGVEAAVENLRQRGILVVVVSSSHSAIVKQDLDLLGIGVDAVFGSDGAEAEKPSPDFLNGPLEFLSRKGVGPGGVVSVGDSLLDYWMSRKRCSFRGVLTGRTTQSDFCDAGVAESEIFASFSAVAKSLITSS